MKFSSTLKELREQNHVTQNQLASHLKLTRSTIVGYETKGKQPDYERLLQICRLFSTYRLIICSQALKPTVFLFRRILPNTVCSVRI